MKKVGKMLKQREAIKKMLDWILNYNLEEERPISMSWPTISGHIANVRLPLKIAVEWRGR